VSSRFSDKKALYEVRGKRLVNKSAIAIYLYPVLHRFFLNILAMVIRIVDFDVENY
jgi:hypothetical protein